MILHRKWLTDLLQRIVPDTSVDNGAKNRDARDFRRVNSNEVGTEYDEVRKEAWRQATKPILLESGISIRDRVGR